MNEYFETVVVTHDLEPYDLIRAYFHLLRISKEYSKGSIHLILVDLYTPSKQVLLLDFQGIQFVIPDNGIAGFFNSQEIKVRSLEIKDSVLDSIVEVPKLIETSEKSLKSTDSFISKKLPIPQYHDELKQLIGVVLYVDHYGNLITNVNISKINEYGELKNIQVNPHFKLNRIYLTREEMFNEDNKYVNDGDMYALINSIGYLEIGIFRSLQSNLTGASSMAGLIANSTISIHFK